jgi:hypothetical protein
MKLPTKIILWLLICVLVLGLHACSTPFGKKESFKVVDRTRPADSPWKYTHTPDLGLTATSQYQATATQQAIDAEVTQQAGPPPPLKPSPANPPPPPSPGRAPSQHTTITTPSSKISTIGALARKITNTGRGPSPLKTAPIPGKSHRSSKVSSPGQNSNRWQT